MTDTQQLLDDIVTEPGPADERVLRLARALQHTITLQPPELDPDAAAIEHDRFHDGWHTAMSTVHTTITAALRDTP